MMEKTLWQHIQTVKTKCPLVHNITNYVVMNTTANALLAVGASAIMAHALPEIKDMVHIADALLVNIGTLDDQWAEAMVLAAETAHYSTKPWVLDPVGAGATPYRNTILHKLLACKPTVIRGNASEILALVQHHSAVTKGVDSTFSSTQAIEAGYALANRFDSVVCISGEKDIILTNEGYACYVNNGHPMMTKVTGLGCTASALITAFVAVIEDKTEATIAAMALLGVVGECSQKQAAGPGSLQMNIIDNLYGMTESVFCTHLHLEVK